MKRARAIALVPLKGSRYNMSYVTVRTGYNTYETIEVENEDRAAEIAAEIAAEDAMNRYDEIGVWLDH